MFRLQPNVVEAMPRSGGGGLERINDDEFAVFRLVRWEGALAHHTELNNPSAQGSPGLNTQGPWISGPKATEHEMMVGPRCSDLFGGRALWLIIQRCVGELVGFRVFSD